MSRPFLLAIFLKANKGGHLNANALYKQMETDGVRRWTRTNLYMCVRGEAFTFTGICYVYPGEIGMLRLHTCKRTMCGGGSRNMRLGFCSSYVGF